MKVALLEIGGSHDECLYAQVKILSSVPGLNLTLICDDSLKDNVKHFKEADNIVFFPIKKGLKKWMSLFQISRYCKTEKFEKIIFNTAQGSLIKSLLHFPFSRQTNFYGILHNIKKLNNSSSQKRISRSIQHYFVLNDYLQGRIKSDISFSIFYPIFYPQYKTQEVSKKIDEVWVCIPGQVELKRRDYKTLFESIKEHGIAPHIKFLLLGKYGHSHGDGDFIKKQLELLNVHDHFLIWKDFIPVETFHSYINQSDYILPLIHRDDESGGLYENQISGAFNLAIGHKKPLMLEHTFSDDFPDALTYDKTNLMKTVNDLKKQKTKDLYQGEKWSFEYIKQQYLTAIGVTSPGA